MQFHCDSHGIDDLRVALGASSVHRAGTFEAFRCAGRALLVDHVGEFIIWTIIDASHALQEETVLAFLTL